MLVLTRFSGESTFITCPDGTKIRVVVERLRADKIRLMFDAPKNYEIHRDDAGYDKEGKPLSIPIPAPRPPSA